MILHLLTNVLSSSESEADFIPPATPMMAMPTRVTTTPMITEEVRAESAPSSGKNMFRSTGPIMVPSPAQVPREADA